MTLLILESRLRGDHAEEAHYDTSHLCILSHGMSHSTADGMDRGAAERSASTVPLSTSAICPNGLSDHVVSSHDLLPRLHGRSWVEPNASAARATSDLGLATGASIKETQGNGKADPTTEDALSLLLGFTSLVSEVRTTSRLLLEQFGSLGAVLAASPRSLRDLLSECPEAIALLQGVQQAMVLALRETVAERPLLSNTAALRDYLRVSMAHEEREMVRLLFLDARNALILDEVHSQGSVSHAPVYPREIVRRLIETNATALIIVHNHPSGDPKPSADDVEMTRRMASVLSGIGVKLQDSVVIGRRGYSSLRSLGLL